MPSGRIPEALRPGPVAVRLADRSHLRPITTMLRSAALPVEGVDALVLRRGMVVACTTAGALVGVAGLEEYGPDRLLRSVVVEPRWRGRGVGRRLVTSLLAQASADQTDVYLLTETSAEVFAAFGFVAIDRSSVSGPVTESYEWREACPASATVMLWQPPSP